MYLSQSFRFTVIGFGRHFVKGAQPEQLLNPPVSSIFTHQAGARCAPLRNIVCKDSFCRITRSAAPFVGWVRASIHQGASLAPFSKLPLRIILKGKLKTATAQTSANCTTSLAIDLTASQILLTHKTSIIGKSAP